MSEMSTILFNGWPAELADHCDVIFHGSDIVYSDRKNGHLLPWPPSGGLGGPFPKAGVGNLCLASQIWLF